MTLFAFTTQPVRVTPDVQLLTPGDDRAIAPVRIRFRVGSRAICGWNTTRAAWAHFLDTGALAPRPLGVMVDVVDGDLRARIALMTAEDPDRLLAQLAASYPNQDVVLEGFHAMRSEDMGTGPVERAGTGVGSAPEDQEERRPTEAPLPSDRPASPETRASLPYEIAMAAVLRFSDRFFGKNDPSDVLALTAFAPPAAPGRTSGFSTVPPGDEDAMGERAGGTRRGERHEEARSDTSDPAAEGRTPVRVTLVVLGTFVRQARDRRFPDDLQAEVADLLRDLAGLARG